MKTVKQLQLSGLLVLLTLLSACQSKPKDGQTDTYTSGVPQQSKTPAIL